MPGGGSAHYLPPPRARCHDSFPLDLACLQQHALRRAVSRPPPPRLRCDHRAWAAAWRNSACFIVEPHTSCADVTVASVDNSGGHLHYASPRCGCLGIWRTCCRCRARINSGRALFYMQHALWPLRRRVRQPGASSIFCSYCLPHASFLGMSLKPLHDSGATCVMTCYQLPPKCMF